jgi:hypothetical protein
VIVRELVAGEGREEDLTRVYGPEGIWAELLRSSPGFLSTECHVHSRAERRFRVLDYWWSHETFEGFRRERQTECEKFSLLVHAEGMVERETVLGVFYEDESGPEEGLVSA